MNVFQYAVLGVGLLLVLSGLDFSKIKSLIASMFNKDKPVVIVDETRKVLPPIDDNTLSNDEVKELMEKKVKSLVAEWEDVREMCVKYDLTNSVDALDKVFPTFLDLVRNKSVVAVATPEKSE